MQHWRRFQFFDFALITEPGTNEPKKLKNFVISGISSGHSIVIGDMDGYVHSLDADLNVTRSFGAHQKSVSYLKQASQIPILVTVGSDDDESIAKIVRIWNMATWDEKGAPALLRNIRLGNQHDVTALAISPDGFRVAVGLADGTVFLVVGDSIRERSSHMHRYILQSENPITGLAYPEHDPVGSLYVISSGEVMVIDVSKETIDRAEYLDTQLGCASGCIAVSAKGELILGRKEGIFFYTTQIKGACRGFDGERKNLMCFKNYLCIVDEVGKERANKNSSNITPKSHAPTVGNTLTLYDDKNKIVGFSSSFQNITYVVAEKSIIFVFTKDGSVFKLVEKDTQTKMDTLFRKNLYQVAIDMAENDDTLAPNTLTEIYREYGDHLYDKGDYEGAIAQYIKTIGKGVVEPSYVIKQFLEAQRIHNLTLYLQHLHEAGEANTNHTTLLLNCYTKLKDVDKLDEFIRNPGIEFSVDTAIKVCRQASYHHHALDLAKRHKKHDWYLKILIEDLKRETVALEYIKLLDFEEIERSLIKFGQALVSALPEETVSFLKVMCTGWLPPQTKEWQEKYQTASKILPMVLSFGMNIQPEEPVRPQVPEKPKKSNVDQYVSLFVNQSDALMEFLEFLVNKGASTPLVCNTLLELYLTDNGDEETLQNRQEKKKRALDLLMLPLPYDDSVALVLCQMHGFLAGRRHLYEKTNAYNELMLFYMENNEYKNILQICTKRAKTDPNLWVRALTYFSDIDPATYDCKEEIIEILKNIEKHQILPPLQVIQILAKSPHATVALVSSYFANTIQAERQSIRDDVERIRVDQKETQKNRQEIESLTSGVIKFQRHKCSRCLDALDLPAYHFFCAHSFHQRCLGENENVCSECLEENKDFRAREKALEESAKKHSDFFRQLENSDDGFSVVAKYFGRSMFDAKPSEPNKMGTLPTIKFDLDDLTLGFK